MSIKKRTYKQRVKRNEMKERHRISAELRKRMRIGRRRHNREDDVDSGSRPLEELVEEVLQGFAAPAREVALDPRSLTDLLLARPETEKMKNMEKGGDRGRLLLPTRPLSKDHPLALPEINTDDGKGPECSGGAPVSSRNYYRHRGDPFVFWNRLGMHPLLLKALQTMRFTHPTPVQEEVLPTVLQHSNSESAATSAVLQKKTGSKKLRCGEKDVVISAETGSGKTLAFALPILHRILTTFPGKDDQSDSALDIAKNEGEDRKYDAETNTEKKTQGTNAKKETISLEDDVSKEKSRFGGKNGQGDGNKTKNRKRTREDIETNDYSDDKGLVKHVAASNTVPRDRIMQALIISPTRELALQINQAFLQLTQHAPHIIIGCVVGGMAPEKQQRVLNRHPHVLICTPGRLWELVQKNEGCYLGHSISRRLCFVVLDEADKLLQSGRFEEVQSLLERIHSDILPAGFVQEREEGAEAGEIELEAGRWDEKRGRFIPFSKKKDGDEDMVDRQQEDVVEKRQRKDVPRPIPMPPDPTQSHRTITFVTSATLSLQTRYERKDLRSKKTVIRTSNADTMATVLQQLEIRPSNARVFTISSKADVVANVKETYLRCPGDSKDLYLYYFLKMYRERAIVFVNAISMLRRLVKLLEVLGIPVAGLHASLQQRQRLKYIDKFRKGERRVLVATDVASRGLDIKDVRYVIHFQLPRTTDAYIHRCGRTARCGGTGLSLLMVSAQEHVAFKKLMVSLGRQSNEIEIFAMQPTIVHQLHSHLKIALQIDKLQKEIDKSRAHNNWVCRASSEAEIDVDDMIDDEIDNENRAKEKAIRLLRKRLELLVKKDMGTAGGKGAFRTSAQALGAKKAGSKLAERASVQVTQKKGSKRRKYG